MEKVPVEIQSMTKIKLSIGIEQFATTTQDIQNRIKQMAYEYAVDNGIDYEYEYRYMIMPIEAYILAELKYDDILLHMTVRKL